MIIGSGLLAKAFIPAFLESGNVCIYAAGVSNSSCQDLHEFEREKLRLIEALELAGSLDAFVYFGTCSVADREVRDTPYVRHKLAMEQLVMAHQRHLILRLPQVAGRTPNPHTLLNYLFARISRSESFCLWRNARRNIIDVDDVAAVTHHLIADPAVRDVTLNVANSISYSMPEIVTAMENAVGKRAVYDVAELGGGYPIDNRSILAALDAAGISFGDAYLQRVIEKYYGKSH